MVRFVISKTLNIELVTQPLQEVARYSPFWCTRSHFWLIVKLHGDLSQAEYSGQISVCIIHNVISAYSPGICWLIRIGVSIVADVVFVLTPGRIRSYTKASL